MSIKIAFSLYLQIMTLILFFTYCSVHLPGNKSKVGQTPTNLKKMKKGVEIINEKLKESIGTRWAICIGINDYEDRTIIDLEKAQNDAKQLGKILKQYGQFDHVYVFTDDNKPGADYYPNERKIKQKLEFLKEIIKPEDMILFSFSGHGLTNSYGKGFLLTADSYTDNNFANCLKVNDVVNWIRMTNVKKAILLLDACRKNFQKGIRFNQNGLKAERFKQAEMVAIFYATKRDWFSYEEEEGNFGVFTKYIIKGLKGEADTSIAGNGDGIVAFLELVAYVEEEVIGWALRNNYRQKPFTYHICKEKFGDLHLSTYIGESGIKQPGDKEVLCGELRSGGLIEMIGDARAYYRVKGDHAENEALKLYRSVIERLSERSRQALNQELLNRAEKYYKKGYFTHAIRYYYALFEGICENHNIYTQRN